MNFCCIHDYKLLTDCLRQTFSVEVLHSIDEVSEIAYNIYNTLYNLLFVIWVAGSVKECSLQNKSLVSAQRQANASLHNLLLRRVYLLNSLIPNSIYSCSILLVDSKRMQKNEE